MPDPSNDLATEWRALTQNGTLRAIQQAGDDMAARLEGRGVAELTDAEIDAGVEAILAKDDIEIMLDRLRELFGADLDVDSRFTIAQVMTAMEDGHRQAIEFSQIVERAKQRASTPAQGGGG